MKRATPLLLLLLAACAAPQRVGGGPRGAAPPADPAPAAASAPDARQDRSVHTELVRDMFNQGQYYAALAHIQEQKRSGASSDELRFLEAETLRKLGRDTEAEAGYRALLNTEYRGQSERGLGLLFASRPQQLPVGIGFLQKAVADRPTDADARNDLGYALMMAGRFAEARGELSTAVELNPAAENSRNNLIVLLLLQGDEKSALALAQQAGVSDDTLAGLRRQAQSFSRPGKPG